MHIEKDLLMFLKHTAVSQRCSMTYIVTKCLLSYRNRVEASSAAAQQKKTNKRNSDAVDSNQSSAETLSN